MLAEGSAIFQMTSLVAGVAAVTGSVKCWATGWLWSAEGWW
jgi:hypothetical protein